MIDLISYYKELVFENQRQKLNISIIIEIWKNFINIDSIKF